MSKKNNNGKRFNGKAAVKSKAPARSVTPVRNSSIPKAVAKPSPSASRKPVIVTREMIAIRAYEISQSPQCGSEFDNWVRAERELRGL